MDSVLGSSFLATLEALIKIAIIIVTGAWLVRRGVFNDSHIRSLSALVVHIALPALIFANIVTGFDAAQYPGWWRFPLIGAALNLVPLGLSRLVFLRDRERSRPLAAMASFQNAGYLVLPIGEFLFPDQFGRFSIYLFLMLLTFNPLLWSIGSYHISHREGRQVGWRQVITTPFIATVCALVLALTGLNRFLPQVFVGSVDLVGQSCVPLATVVLGFTMGLLHIRRMPSLWALTRVVAIKMLAVPVLMLLLLKYTSFSSGMLEHSFWILEAASPPATGLALQAVHFGGDENLVCGTMVVTYLLALLTIPLFFSLAQVLL